MNKNLIVNGTFKTLILNYRGREMNRKNSTRYRNTIGKQERKVDIDAL